MYYLSDRLISHIKRFLGFVSLGFMVVSYATNSGPQPNVIDPQATETFLYIEAEAATLAAPMASVADTAASGEAYVAVANGSDNGGTGFAEVAFNIATGGDYVVWARVLAPATDDNSFNVSVDGAASTLWDLAVNSTWTWEQVKAPSTTSAQIYSFLAGAHTLKFGNAEDGTRLDKILITSDQAYVPTGLGDNIPYTIDVAEITGAATLVTGLEQITAQPSGTVRAEVPTSGVSQSVLLDTNGQIVAFDVLVAGKKTVFEFNASNSAKAYVMLTLSFWNFPQEKLSDAYERIALHTKFSALSQEFLNAKRFPDTDIVAELAVDVATDLANEIKQELKDVSASLSTQNVINDLGGAVWVRQDAIHPKRFNSTGDTWIDQRIFVVEKGTYSLSYDHATSNISAPVPMNCGTFSLAFPGGTSEVLETT